MDLKAGAVCGILIKRETGGMKYYTYHAAGDIAADGCRAASGKHPDNRLAEDGLS